MPTRPAASSLLARAAVALCLVAAFVPGQAPGQAQEIVRAHGISSFGDLKYPSDFKHFDYVNPDAPTGGVWSSYAYGTFDSLHTFILKGDTAAGIGLIYDSLLTGSADEPDSAYGLVAHTIEYPADRSWVIFEMRPEAKFADGSPVTAEDVAFTFNILKTKGSPSYRVSLREIETAEALENYKVKYTFAKGASTRDLISTAGGLPILSKAWWATRDFEKSSLEKPLGSGVYEVGEINIGRSISYKRRDDYWGRDLPVNVGQSNFDEIRFEYFRDYSASFEGFKGGAYLFHEEFFSKNWATGYDFPALKKGWVKQDTIPDKRPSGTQGFWINTRRDKFKDPRVREALGYAFDFEWSNKTLFYGLYSRTDSFFENSETMEAKGPPSPEEVALLSPLAANLPAGVFDGPPFSPPETNGSGSDRRILRQGMKLLDEAGWKVIDGLRRNDKGETLTLEILDDSPTFERIIGPFVENLRKMGVDASLRIVDPAQYQRRTDDFDYDMIPGRFAMSLTPSNELHQLFGSQSVNAKGTANLAGVANPAVDALIEAAIASKSRDELNTAARALDRVLRAMHIWVPNWYKGSHNLAYWDVFGYPENKPPYSRGAPDLWWWDAEKAAKLKAEGAL